MLTVVAGNRRLYHREAVLRAAQISFGDCAFDCQVVDQSADGVRVRMGAPQPVPIDAMLVFRSGETFPISRRWSLGKEIGFSLRVAPDLG